MKDRWISIRVSEGIIKKLNELCDENDRTKTAQIEEMIKNEWQKTFKK